MGIVPVTHFCTGQQPAQPYHSPLPCIVKLVAFGKRASTPSNTRSRRSGKARDILGRGIISRRGETWRGRDLRHAEAGSRSATREAGAPCTAMFRNDTCNRQQWILPWAGGHLFTKKLPTAIQLIISQTVFTGTVFTPDHLISRGILQGPRRLRVEGPRTQDQGLA